MRFTSKEAHKLEPGKKYWVAWHHCYQMYSAIYVGPHPFEKCHLFEFHYSISKFTEQQMDFYYICSTEIEARRAMIQEIEKSLVESNKYLNLLISKRDENKTTKEV